MNKSELRKYLKALRSEMGKYEVEEKSKIICDHLIDSDVFKKASVIMLYIPIKNEVDTKPIVQKAFSEGKTVLVPHTEGDNIYPAVLKNTDLLVPGEYNIKEPEEKIIWNASIDLCVVPGVGFSMHGARIGFGKGCYDRFLKERNMKKIGIAYAFQITDKINSEPHDISMDIIATEEGLFYCE